MLTKQQQYEKAYREAHPEQRCEYQRKYKERHKERLAAAGKVYRDSDPARIKAQRRRSTYGIEPEQFNSLLEKQNGKCAICFMEFKQDGKKSEVAVVDHCHTTGAVRGLLCLKCNNGIGLLQDNVDVILSAASYLKNILTEEIYDD